MEVREYNGSIATYPGAGQPRAFSLHLVIVIIISLLPSIQPNRIKTSRRDRPCLAIWHQLQCWLAYGFYDAKWKWGMFCFALSLHFQTPPFSQLWIKNKFWSWLHNCRARRRRNGWRMWLESVQKEKEEQDLLSHSRNGLRTRPFDRDGNDISV